MYAGDEHGTQHFVAIHIQYSNYFNSIINHRQRFSIIVYMYTQCRSKENLFQFISYVSMCHAHTCAMPKISFSCEYTAKKCLFVQHLQCECLVSTQLSKRNKPLIELSHTFVHTKCRHCSDFATNSKFKALALK